MGHFNRLMVNFRRRPDVSQASKVGEPTLVPPPETSALDVAQQAQRALVGPGSGTGTGSVSVEAGAAGTTPPVSQPIPRSPGSNSAPATAAGGTVPDNAVPELKPVGDAAQPVTQPPQAPPTQVNEAAGDSQSSSSTASSTQQGSSSSSSSTQGSNDAQSSSKAKKKKRKLWPF